MGLSYITSQYLLKHTKSKSQKCISASASTTVPFTTNKLQKVTKCPRTEDCAGKGNIKCLMSDNLQMR